MIRLPAIAAVSAAAIGVALADGLDIVARKALFEREWIAAPASTDAADGLGPLFNAKSCNSCHKDGGAARFFTLDGDLLSRGLVIRLAARDGSPHPRLGVQLQDRAVPGARAEGSLDMRLSGSALKVNVKFRDPSVEDVLVETRIAPSLRGRGMVERVDEYAVIALADADDADGDGISGRARFVDDGSGRRALGRFGYKAQVASLELQTADAASIDLGLSSKSRPFPHGDCTPFQQQCLAMATGRSEAFDGEELSREMVSLISDYVRSLERKDRKLPEAEIRLFADLGCAACHRPAMPDRRGHRLPVFSDLLLHDLGPAAASAIVESGVSPAEWRTAPLIDLDPMEGERRYLHDGRAASIEEAIAHHGGEADAARLRFLALSESDRRALIAFLSAL